MPTQKIDDADEILEPYALSNLEIREFITTDGDITDKTCEVLSGFMIHVNPLSFAGFLKAICPKDNFESKVISDNQTAFLQLVLHKNRITRNILPQIEQTSFWTAYWESSNRNGTPYIPYKLRGARK